HHARLTKRDVCVSDSPYSCLVPIPISDSDARHMLDFAARWRPGGGGSAEDIFVLYGLSSQVFFERLQSLIRTGRAQTPRYSPRRPAARCLPTPSSAVMRYRPPIPSTAW